MYLNVTLLYNFLEIYDLESEQFFNFWNIINNYCTVVYSSMTIFVNSFSISISLGGSSSRWYATNSNGAAIELFRYIF